MRNKTQKLPVGQNPPKLLPGVGSSGATTYTLTVTNIEKVKTLTEIGALLAGSPDYLVEQNCLDEIIELMHSLADKTEITPDREARAEFIKHMRIFMDHFEAVWQSLD